MNRQITNDVAVLTLETLIADRERKMGVLLPFMTEEIEHLQMEIDCYRRDLLRIERGCASNE